jgi:hypothetical protein
MPKPAKKKRGRPRSKELEAICTRIRIAALKNPGTTRKRTTTDAIVAVEKELRREGYRPIPSRGALKTAMNRYWPRQRRMRVLHLWGRHVRKGFIKAGWTLKKTPDGRVFQEREAGNELHRVIM